MPYNMKRKKVESLQASRPQAVQPYALGSALSSLAPSGIGGFPMLAGAQAPGMSPFGMLGGQPAQQSGAGNLDLAQVLGMMGAAFSAEEPNSWQHQLGQGAAGLALQRKNELERKEDKAYERSKDAESMANERERLRMDRDRFNLLSKLEGLRYKEEEMKLTEELGLAQARKNAGLAPGQDPPPGFMLTPQGLKAAELTTAQIAAQQESAANALRKLESEAMDRQHSSSQLDKEISARKEIAQIGRTPTQQELADQMMQYIKFGLSTANEQIGGSGKVQVTRDPATGAIITQAPDNIDMGSWMSDVFQSSLDMIPMSPQERAVLSKYKIQVPPSGEIGKPSEEPAQEIANPYGPIPQTQAPQAPPAFVAPSAQAPQAPGPVPTEAWKPKAIPPEYFYRTGSQSLQIGPLLATPTPAAPQKIATPTQEPTVDLASMLNPQATPQATPTAQPSPQVQPTPVPSMQQAGVQPTPQATPTPHPSSAAPIYMDKAEGDAFNAWMQTNAESLKSVPPAKVMELWALRKQNIAGGKYR